jgi:hypothetical protein
MGSGCLSAHTCRAEELADTRFKSIGNAGRVFIAGCETGTEIINDRLSDGRWRASWDSIDGIGVGSDWSSGWLSTTTASKSTRVGWSGNNRWDRRAGNVVDDKVDLRRD